MPSPTSTPADYIGNPYPNPVRNEGGITFYYSVSGPSVLNWTVFTVAFRKILEGSVPVNGAGVINWPLKDNWNHPVANGLYYIRVEVTGKVKMTKILKAVVER
jgi:hypothetical protein